MYATAHQPRFWTNGPAKSASESGSESEIFHSSRDPPALSVLRYSRRSMGLFTQLTEEQIAALTRGFGADRTVGPVTGFRAIPAGTINSNFRIECERGALFLRINEGKSEEDVRYEADLVAALVGGGVASPVPFRTDDGTPFVMHDGRHVSLFPWLDGSHRAGAAIEPGHTAALGRALARLHLVGLDLFERFDRPSRYTFAEIIERHRQVAASERGQSDPVLAPALAAVADEIPWLEARDEVRDAATTGIIHGDLFPDNVLFADGSATISALIDFEQASTGSLAYDLAVCINAWCYRDDFDPALIAGLVSGYQEVRPLTESDIAALEVEVRAAAMRFTVTRITDVYLPGMDSSAKDFRRYLARLQRWREVGRDGLHSWAKLGE